MGKFYVVSFSGEEFQELYLYLKLFGYKFANGKSLDKKDVHFPFCIDIERKVVYLTNVCFLKAFKQQGGEFLTVENFKKAVGNF